jgi:NAD(P)H-dependent FMN reductase/ketosteroid isomerase-like protein
MHMAGPFDVAVLVGSLRNASITRKVANALIAASGAKLRCRLIELDDLPIYNQDLDDKPPPSWVRFRQDIAGAQAVLFLTPEYNRSVPGCLKNALDVGSRPEGKSVWSGKPAGIVSVTPYKLGAFGANHALRQALVFLNVPAMQQPEAYIGGAADLFDAQGSLKDDDTKKFLTTFAAAFEHWVERLTASATPGSFDGFMRQREEAARAYVGGDVSPLDAIVAREGTATFLPPNGGQVQGAAEVAARYRTDAKSFAPGGDSHFEIMQSGASGNLAFWTGFQNATAKIGGRDVAMQLRITELFRFEGGEWKLFHRHADQAKSS